MTEQIDEKAIAVIEKNLAPLLVRAQKIVITTQEEQNTAGEILTHINKYADEMEKEKKGATDPLNQSLKKIRGWFKPREENIEAAVSALRSEMGRYQLEADKKAREEEAKIAARVKDGKGNLKPETAVRKMDEIERPNAHIETAGGAGSVKFRTDKKLKIIDEIALKKHLVNSGYYQMVEVVESAVLAGLKQGEKFPGAEIEEVKIVVNSR